MDKEFNEYLTKRVEMQDEDKVIVQFTDVIVEKSSGLVDFLLKLKLMASKKFLKNVVSGFFAAVILTIVDTFDDAIDCCNEMKTIIAEKEKEFNKSR